VPRIRSLLPKIEIDEAKRAHNCQGNGRHRIRSGERRLNVRSGRGWDRYCLDCAAKIVGRDIGELEELARAIDPE
jgi:hypothetical protein